MACNEKTNQPVRHHEYEGVGNPNSNCLARTNLTHDQSMLRSVFDSLLEVDRDGGTKPRRREFLRK